MAEEVITRPRPSLLATDVEVRNIPRKTYAWLSLKQLWVKGPVTLSSSIK